MKKFSTIVLPLNAILALLLVCSPVLAAKENSAIQKDCAFLPNAPDQHVVVRGDTLWGISQKFLEHPWCWPKVWGMNKEEIKNPHWIYPGQIVYLDRATGKLRLGKPLGSGNVSNVRLSPQIRSENAAISSIPSGMIKPFLSQPLILEEDALAKAPRIVAASENRVNIGRSDRAYVMGDLNHETDFLVYRPAEPLIDPVTQQVLGYESAYVGEVSLARVAKTPDEAHSFVATKTKEELTIGDRLIPIPAPENNNYVPHPPNGATVGHVVSVYGGVAQAGQNQTVAINLGSKDGMDVGTVLKMYRTGDVIADRTNDNNPVRLPDEEYGTLFVYRIFNNASYGLIMRVTDSAQVGDIVRSPE